jgi:hypothetical protein
MAIDVMRTAVVAAVVLALPASAAATDGYLTKREAKRETRARIKKEARLQGTTADYIKIDSCHRRSRRRIRCYFYANHLDGTYCEGRMQVIERASSWATRGIGVECYQTGISSRYRAMSLRF